MEASSGVISTFNIDIVPVWGLRFKLFHGIAYARISRGSGLTRHTCVQVYLANDDTGELGDPDTSVKKRLNHDSIAFLKP